MEGREGTTKLSRKPDVRTVESHHASVIEREEVNVYS